MVNSITLFPLSVDLKISPFLIVVPTPPYTMIPFMKKIPNKRFLIYFNFNSLTSFLIFFFFQISKNM